MPDALFSTLGISPTTDQKAIRRAYAALLKRTDQAGDPEGFAALREAYERARAWAEWQREQDDDAPEPGPSPMETETAAAPPSLDPASAQDESRPTGTPLAGEAAPAWTVSEPAPGPTPEQQAEGVIHWTRTLMQAAADQHTTLLGKAMLDERLSRLDAVEQLSASLAQSIRDQPDRQLALFEAATRHFGWNEVGQPFPDDWNLSLWFQRIQDQMEFLARLPPEQYPAMQAALRAARRWRKPMFWQAIKHGDSLETLCREAPDLAALDIGAGAATAWRGAAARWLRGRWLLAWMSMHRIKVWVAIVCVLALIYMYHDAHRPLTYPQVAPLRSVKMDGHVTVKSLTMKSYAEHCVSGPLADLGWCTVLGVPPGRWPDDLPDALVFAKYPDPIYPTGEWRNGIGGVVYMRVLLDEKGVVRHAVILSPDPNRALNITALAAADQLRMQPVERDGKPSFSQAVLVFRYIPDSPSSRQR